MIAFISPWRFHTLLCRPSRLSWTRSRGIVIGLGRVGELLQLAVDCCYLQMMRSWWLHGSVAFSTHCMNSQPSRKRLGLRSPLNLRAWFSAGSQWTVHSEWGMSPHPKWRSSSILVTCSPVRGLWSRRMAREHQVLCLLYCTVVMKREPSQKAKL